MKNKLSLALATFVVYALIMVAGMYNLHYILHSNYSSPLMPKYLLWFEVVMALMVVIIYVKFFAHQLSYQRPRPISLVFVVGYGIMIVNLLIMFYRIFTTGHFDPKFYGLVISITLAVVCVAISEETMFRGILLPALLTKCNRIWAIILSAICFSAFHLINLVGGLPFHVSIHQLQNTFLMGLVFACFATEFGSIIPGMILHFFLDFDLLIGFNTGSNIMSNYQFAQNFNPWFGVFMVLFLSYKAIKSKMTHELTIV